MIHHLTTKTDQYRNTIIIVMSTIIFILQPTLPNNQSANMTRVFLWLWLLNTLHIVYLVSIYHGHIYVFPILLFSYFAFVQSFIVIISLQLNMGGMVLPYCNDGYGIDIEQPISAFGNTTNNNNNTISIESGSWSAISVVYILLIEVAHTWIFLLVIVQTVLTAT